MTKSKMGFEDLGSRSMASVTPPPVKASVEFTPTPHTPVEAPVGQGSWEGGAPTVAAPRPSPAPSEKAQLGLRTDRADVEWFKRLAEEGNWSQPQLLRRALRAYEMVQHKEDLGR